MRERLPTLEVATVPGAHPGMSSSSGPASVRRSSTSSSAATRCVVAGLLAAGNDEWSRPDWRPPRRSASPRSSVSRRTLWIPPPTPSSCAVQATSARSPKSRRVRAADSPAASAPRRRREDRPAPGPRTGRLVPGAYRSLGFQTLLHCDGELATARGAARSETIMCVPTLSEATPAEIAAHAPGARLDSRSTACATGSSRQT